MDGIGNFETFRLQIKILLEQNFSDLIYFAEDDYFYLPNQFVEMVEFLKDNSDADFVSPYDHIDYYRTNIHEYESTIKISKNKHWRTAGSTCLTFLTTKKTLEKTKKTFLSYGKGNPDWTVWLSLTKNSSDNMKILIKSLKHPGNIRNLYRSYSTNNNQVLNNKIYKLWIPIPAIATHMEKECLSPTIDWENVMKKSIDQQNLLK